MSSLTTQLNELGLSEVVAEKISSQVQDIQKKFSPPQSWQVVVKEILSSGYPFAVHDLLYKTIYPTWEQIPAPAWLPSENEMATTNIAKLMHSQKLKSYADLHLWSVNQYQEFWQTMTQMLDIHFSQPFTSSVNLSAGVEKPIWFPGATLNIINSCFQAPASATAIVSQTESGMVTRITYDELNKLSNRIANSLCQHAKKGAKIAIIMPMTHFAVAIYLGIIKAGCVVVAIPDSFAADEIATRLKIANTSIVFCQDQIIRDGKVLPLYERVVNAQAPFTIVLPNENELHSALREHDLSWKNFLGANENFTALDSTPHAHINILFSSGTTGAPKAIPWTQTAPIKAASDAHLHHNLQPGDIFCWPTNLGWMMGPWLIFACLINKATIALFEGSPNAKNFGKFVQDMEVTHLGVVPTMVRTWHSTACMEDCDWHRIKIFTSTGERANTEDMLYLMSLADYRPVIEYCGGTEIAGAYITGTLMQPVAPAAFTTPALGLDFVILDEQGKPAQEGEVALIPPVIGFSTELLNKDHHEVYYADMPPFKDKLLRRHGDQIKHYPNGFYRLLGRVDDTMKLGGIKISSAEIETILNALPPIYEAAAIAYNPPDGGPSQLIIYVVTKTQENIDTAALKTAMQNAIKQHLNPLFKIQDVIMVDALPRTASNKIMRRVLRDKYAQSKQA